MVQPDDLSSTRLSTRGLLWGTFFLSVVNLVGLVPLTMFAVFPTEGAPTHLEIFGVLIVTQTESYLMFWLVLKSWLLDGFPTWGNSSPWHRLIHRKGNPLFKLYAFVTFFLALVGHLLLHLLLQIIIWCNTMIHIWTRPQRQEALKAYKLWQGLVKAAADAEDIAKAKALYEHWCEQPATSERVLRLQQQRRAQIERLTSEATESRARLQAHRELEADAARIQ